MPDLTVLSVILAVGSVTYAMRSGGFLLAGRLAPGGPAARLLRHAPGNLFVAFATAGLIEGGLPAAAGSVVAVGLMALLRREWLALGAGFAAAGLTALLRG